MKINSKTKVVFIEPTGSYSNVFAQFMTIPMLGPLYLGTIAEKAGFDVSILNENILRRNVREDELLEADILCLSCMTATIERGKKIARQYKKVRESKGLESHSIVGGIHASMLPEDVANDFDQVFIGEGESKIVPLLQGIISDKFVYGEKIEDLDTIPTPNFRLIKNFKRVKTFPIMTSRGCPYDCNFCSVTEMFGRGYRAMSAERVIEEIKKYDAKELFFVDDHFVVKKQRTRDILRGMLREKLNLQWSCQLRADVSRDTELVSMMREANCKTVYIGFESVNQKSLDDIKKSQTVEGIRKAANVFKENGILVHGMFMLGSDSDDAGIFDTTSRFCRDVGLSSVQFMILTPLPGTEFYRNMENQGRLLHKKWDFYDALHVVFEPKNFTPAELQQGMIDCFDDFYSYTNAFNDAIDVFFRTASALGKKLFQETRIPSIESVLVKIGGRQILRRWIRFNRPYLGYLTVLSMNKD